MSRRHAAGAGWWTTLAASAAVALAAATIAGSPAFAEAVQGDVTAAPFAACTLDRSGEKPVGTEHSSCVSVVANLSHAPAVGEQAILEFTVAAAVAVSRVTIHAELPPHLRWVTRPAGLAPSTRTSKAAHLKGTLQAVSTTKAMTAGQRLRFTGIVRAVATGPTEINVKATGSLPGDLGAGADAVFLTIAKAGGDSRFGIAVKDKAPAVRASGPRAPAPKTNPAKTPGKGVPTPATQVPRSRVMQSPQGNACVTGSWHFTDNNGILHSARSWRLEVWDQDADGDDLLASSMVLDNGLYFVCFNNGDTDGGGEQDVYVRFFAENTLWRVTNAVGDVYNYVTDVVPEIPDGGTHNFFGLMPGVPEQMRAAAAFEAVAVIWFGVPGSCWDMNSTCRPVVIRWEPASTDGTFYSTGTNDVHLVAVDPDAPIAVAHEAAHSIMDDVYDDAVPATPNCNPHNITMASSTGCAWVEGFAEWLPAIVFNDPFLRWPNGSALNLEDPTWDTPGWDDGDTVEGRVAGAMIDLSDGTNEGTDRASEGINNLWTTFQNHNSATFQEFWTDRGNDGFDVSNNALGSLFQSTIDYGFVP